MTIVDPFGTLANLCSIAGFSGSFVGWLVSAKAGKSRQTIDDYLEWLRRQDQRELADRIESVRGEVSQLIEDVKESVVEAALLHELGATSRNEKLLVAIDKVGVLRRPTLQIRMLNKVSRDLGYRFNCAYQVHFEAVNTSNSNADIQAGSVVINDSHGTLNGNIHWRQQGLHLSIPPHNGTNAFCATTNPVAQHESERNDPVFKLLTIRLSQDRHERTFVRGDGEYLQEQNSAGF